MSTPPADLPSVPRQLITTRDALLELCAHLKAAGSFAFDTEFIGERSYQAQLCLVQVATTERVELIDPFALPDLAPLWDLMADASIEKICHAGEQDLEIVWQKSGHRTEHVRDVQLAAGLVGLGYPLAYWRLVEEFAGVDLAKAHTFSAWDARPLSRDQITYAVDDVRYLPLVWTALRARLEALGHLDWLAAACADLAEQSATPVDPRRLYLRVKGLQGLNARQLAALRELAAWREQLAFEHDVPARNMLRDEVLVELASRMPGSSNDLDRVRALPEAERTTYAGDILALVATARALPESELPVVHAPPEDSLAARRLADQLWSAAQIICHGQSVTPALVTSQAEMTALARRLAEGRDPERHVLMTGWHKNCLGEPLLAFLRGQTTLHLSMQEHEMRLTSDQT